MRLYGIFDQNNNYKLLRYSTDEQTEHTYSYTNPVTKASSIIHEVCIADIDYAEEYIGQYFNPNTKTFSVS